MLRASALQRFRAQPQATAPTHSLPAMRWGKAQRYLRSSKEVLWPSFKAQKDVTGSTWDGDTVLPLLRGSQVLPACPLLAPSGPPCVGSSAPGSGAGPSGLRGGGGGGGRGYIQRQRGDQEACDVCLSSRGMSSKPSAAVWLCDLRRSFTPRAWFPGCCSFSWFLKKDGELDGLRTSHYAPAILASAILSACAGRMRGPFAEPRGGGA